MKAARGLLAALLAAAVPAPAPGGAPVDESGDWHLRIARSDKGAAVLGFGPPVAGVFSVDGLGMTLGLGEFFEVTGQTLERDSSGRISGALALEAVGGGPLGSLVLDRGSVNETFTKLKLPGTRAPPAGEALGVVAKGVRLPDPAPVLTGATTVARVAGGGLKSRVYELSVEADPFGHPVFTFAGIGPVTVDGVETPAVETSGRFLLDPKGRVFGTFASPLLGAGVVEGKLKTKELFPLVKLKVTTATRKFRMKGELVNPVSPILSVTPAGAAEFGSVSIGGSAESVYSLRNTGLGSLDGEASLAPGGDPDFAVLDAGGASVPSLPYSILPGESVLVRLRFAPTVVGERTATLQMTGGGGAVRTLRGLGANLSVVPSAGHDFGDVAVGASQDRDFLVTNIGTGRLVGEAVVAAGSPDFAIRDGGQSVTSLVYDLGAGEVATVTVRFAPAAEGALEGQLSFSGGAAAVTRPVAGTGTAAP